MWPMPLNVFDSCCVDIKSAERELFQPSPCPGGLVLHAGGLPHRPLPSSLFPSECPPLLSRFLPRFPPWFFRRVGCSTPTTPRLLHSRLFCLLTCDLRALLLSSLRVPRFPRRRLNFAAVGTVAAGNDFALLGCITTSRCCWHACTVSIGMFSHHSMSCVPSVIFPVQRGWGPAQSA